MVEYFLQKVEIKDCTVKIDGKNVLEQPVKKIMLQHMRILEKLLLVKEMIMQLVIP